MRAGQRRQNKYGNSERGVGRKRGGQRGTGRKKEPVGHDCVGVLVRLWEGGPVARNHENRYITLLALV